MFSLSEPMVTLQEILAYKLSSKNNTMVRSQTTGAIATDSDSPVSKLRHRSGETELSTSPRKDLRLPSRRVKSQENLSSSLNSDSGFLPLSSSKDALSESKSSVSRDSDNCSNCTLVWQRSFAYPVIGMNRLDIMDDGMEDFIVVTLKGIHILQVLYLLFAFWVIFHDFFIVCKYSYPSTKSEGYGIVHPLRLSVRPEPFLGTYWSDLIHSFNRDS